MSRVAKRTIKPVQNDLGDLLLQHGIPFSALYNCHHIISENLVYHKRFSQFEDVMQWIAQFSPGDAIAVNGMPISGNKKLMATVMPLLRISKALTFTQAA